MVYEIIRDLYVISLYTFILSVRPLFLVDLVSDQAHLFGYRLLDVLRPIKPLSHYPSQPLLPHLSEPLLGLVEPGR